MGKETTNLEALSSREGFNSAVRYINKTIDISEELGAKNLADILFERGDLNLSGERGAYLLNMLLVDKLGYIAISRNLESVATDLGHLAKEFGRWKGVDLVVVYHHQDLGLLIANPKVAEELANFGLLRKRELMVVYSGKGNIPADQSCQKAAELALSIFEGKNVKAPVELLRGNFTVKNLKATVSISKEEPARKSTAKPKGLKTAKPAKARQTVSAPSVRLAAPVVTAAAPAISVGPVRMTPMYSVVVSNELFHNGNVEAWKRIIASYNAKHPDLSVFVYYEGERILDINTLFKWGKVKHGSSIQFAVSGNDIKDVAKLQRYFVQGSSSRFEAFLHGPVNNVLRLFG